MKIYDYLSEHKVPKVIEPTVEAIESYGTGYGAELTFISRDHINALLDGKLLAFDDGEYAHFLIFGEPPNVA